MWDSL